MSIIYSMIYLYTILNQSFYNSIIAFLFIIFLPLFYFYKNKRFKCIREARHLRNVLTDINPSINPIDYSEFQKNYEFARRSLAQVDFFLGGLIYCGVLIMITLFAFLVKMPFSTFMIVIILFTSVGNLFSSAGGLQEAIFSLNKIFGDDDAQERNM